MAAEGDSKVACFAKRRPDWALPELHIDLRLEPFDVLRGAGRQHCPNCKGSKFLYCYDCLVPFTHIPKVELPFKVSVITHFEESRSKNTGVHAAILAPGFAELHSLEQCPEFDPQRAIVLFPSDDAINVEEVDVTKLDRLFIIDSKWKKARALVNDIAIANVRRVKLRDTHSAFWRYHTRGVSDEGVCTIEALYFLLQGLQKAGKFEGDERFSDPHYFDNLLWYFVYQHQLVKEAAEKRNGSQVSEQGASGPPTKQQKTGGGQDASEVPAGSQQAPAADQPPMSGTSDAVVDAPQRYEPVS